MEALLLPFAEPHCLSRSGNTKCLPWRIASRVAPICDESLLTSLTHIDDTCLLLKNCWTRRVLCGEYYVQPVLSKSDHRFWQPRRSCFGLSVRRQPLSVNHLDTMLDTNDASKMCALLDKPSLSCTQKAVPETLVWLCVGRTLSPKKQGVCYFFSFLVLLAKSSSSIYIVSRVKVQPKPNRAQWENDCSVKTV